MRVRVLKNMNSPLCMTFAIFFYNILESYSAASYSAHSHGGYSCLFSEAVARLAEAQATAPRSHDVGEEGRRKSFQLA